MQRRVWILSLVGLIAIALCTSARAQNEEDTAYFEGWKKSLVFDLTATQASYSDSWDGGEAGTFSWQSNLVGRAEKYLSPKFHLLSNLKLSFGQSHRQEDDGDWLRPQKTTDRIDWENVGSFKLSHAYVDPYLAFRLQSRFYDDRIPAKKLWLTPLELSESGGVLRKFYEKDDDFISSRFGFALHQTFTTDISDTTTLATVDSTFFDGGIESVTDVSLSVHDNILWNSKLTLYKAIFFDKADEVKGTPSEDYWKAVDVDWENIFVAELSKVFAVILYTQVLYDKQIDLRGRWKQTLALGINYRLI